MRLDSIIIILTVSIGMCDIESAQADNNESQVIIQTIRKAWTARAARFASAEINFTRKAIGRKAMYDSVAGLAVNNADDGKYLEFTNETRMLFAGDRISHAIKGELPGGTGKEGKTLRDTIETSNGKESKRLDLSLNKAPGEYPCGEIYDRTTNNCIRYAGASPACWTFCSPKSEVYDFASHLSFNGYFLVGGQKCLLCETKRHNGQIRNTYYIDPGKDYSIVRLVSKTNDVVEFQLECSYEPDPSRLWIPKRWVASFLFPDGKISESSTYELKSYKINVPVTDGDFDIVFPIGTFVRDQRKHPEIGRTGTLDYIVMEDKSKRIVRWNERYATFDELLKTKSGEAGQRGTPQSPLVVAILWSLLGVVAVLGVVALLVAIRIKKRPVNKGPV